MTDRADALFLAAHPDDAEIACGGTILRLVAAGRRVVVVDLTRGEMATRGTPELRAQEAAAATERLGVALRENLGLPDGRLTDDEPSVGAVVEVLRRHRPALLFAPVEADAHPDHAATARIAGKAFFTAGLRRAHPGTGEAFRPRLLLRYPGNDAVPATFCVDTSEFVAGKREAIECYASQIGRTTEERAHYLRGLDPVERAMARDRWFGAQCGCEAAEPFVVDGPFSVDHLTLLLARKAPA